MAVKLEVVKKAKELPAVERRATDPAAGQRPKSEQVKINKKHLEAKLAAEKAYKDTMAGVVDVNPELKNAESDVIKFDQMLKTKKNKLVELETELEESSDGEKKAIKMEIGKAKRQVADALERLEGAKIKVKSLS